MHHADPIPLTRLPMTRHALRRAAQRGLGPQAITATLLWGRETRAGGGDRFIYLGRNEVQRARKQGVELARHLGTTLIETPNGQIKTVYRNKEPPPTRHRRKRRH